MQNRIKELRKEKGFTQAELAKLLNVSDRSVGFYENGERDPDTETLNRLADLFSVSIDYLLGRSDICNLVGTSKAEVEESHDLDTSGLPEEAIKKVEDYIELIKLKYSTNKHIKRNK